MSEPVKNETQERLAVLRQIIREGTSATQEEFCEALKEKKYEVTQSTVSRDLRRIGAIKTVSAEGETTYCLPGEFVAMAPQREHDFSGLVTEVQSNENMIIVNTTPGSASLVARHLDGLRNELQVLGTLAGDDTIFVIPTSVKRIKYTIKKIKGEFW